MARLSSLTRIAAVPLLLSGIGTAQIPGPVGDAEFDQRKTHWAWQPLAQALPPAAGHPVDAFVDGKLAAAGLRRSPPAPPSAQLRRLWFDLIGLPPSADAVARFTADPSDAAWAREVDSLLANPQFGERWARHWLDLVRFAETLGHEYDFEVPNAFRYRDYVIRAFRDDVPYDQFLREHIAGDLLPVPRKDADGNNESVQATGHFWFVEQTHSPVDAMQHQADRIDNQVDVLGKAVLGLTVACARCHDHKFDAIRASDYYALVGFVQSSRYLQAPIKPYDVEHLQYQATWQVQKVLAATWAEEARGDGWPGHRAMAPEHWRDEPPLQLHEGERAIASADGPREQWFVTNDAFGSGPWRGPFCPDPKAERPQLLVLPGAFWNSAIAGTAREGVLSTPTFRIDERWLHVRAAGQHSRIKVVVDGFHLVRDPIYGELHRGIDDPNAHWVTFDLNAWLGRQAFVQCIDQRTPDLADPDYERSLYPELGWLAVQTVVSSKHQQPPATPETMPLPGPGWQQLAPRVAAVCAQLLVATGRLPISPTVPSLADGPGRDEHVYLRGDHRRLGAIAPRRFLTAIAGNAAFATGPGSGRLALADAVLSADDPLVPRVLVNRVWHHLFGRGIVRSVDNLGALGDRPTHPELLDWLARDFVAHGWSQKHVVKLLVTSAAYRQDSRPRDDASTLDAGNLLLHRQNVRRLDAEAVRDSLLAISGRLDSTMFGPSIELPRDTHIDARGRPKASGPLDGDGRRSIYLAVRRNFLPPMLLAFDLPTPFATVGARNVSNVPAQALALANDPFVQAECARWAEQLTTTAASSQARITAAYQRAFARQPSDEEIALCSAFLAEQAEHGLADLLHTLVNTTEFLYLR